MARHVAVLAVLNQGVLTVAWCGDSRAWHLSPAGELTPLTSDHNLAQVLRDEGLAPGPYARNTVTSYLGWPPWRLRTVAALRSSAPRRSMRPSAGS